MIERIVPAKNGYTVYAGDQALHSRYDPVVEAERYIAALGIEKPCACFVLIEPGLGYLAASLRLSFPQSEVLCLHCSGFFAQPVLSDGTIAASLPGADFPFWAPGASQTLEDFLEETLAGKNAADIKLIEWKPAVAAYGRSCLELAEKTVQCIRRISAGTTTVRNFGRRWVRNGLRNLSLLNTGAELKPGKGTVLVCASGPGLETLLPSIAKWKEEAEAPFLIAVSSALPALRQRGITPDLVVAADGGSWAAFHLTEGLRWGMRNGGWSRLPVLAAAFTAALPSQTAERPAFFLCDGSLWQTLLLRSSGLPFLTFPQRGTVSASALDLAFFAGTGSVYIAGLDLSHRDILTHARPHAFDTFLENGSSRLCPRYFRNFERALAITRSGSSQIYAEWFKTYRNSWPGRLYTLGMTEAGIPEASLSETAFSGTALSAASMPRNKKAETAPRFDFFPLEHTLTEESSGTAWGKALLLQALGGPMAKQLEKELGELLAPDSTAEERLSMLKRVLKEI